MHCERLIPLPLVRNYNRRTKSENSQPSLSECIGIQPWVKQQFGRLLLDTRGVVLKKRCASAILTPLHFWFKLKSNSDTKYRSDDLTRIKFLQLSQSATRRNWNEKSRSSSKCKKVWERSFHSTTSLLESKATSLKVTNVRNFSVCEPWCSWWNFATGYQPLAYFVIIIFSIRWHLTFHK